MATAAVAQAPGLDLSDKLENISLPSTRNVSNTPETHYKSWPNSIGFESDYTQPTPIDLKVTGHIPAYAAGTLYRTGPGTYKVTTKDGKAVEQTHWFDGFSVAHRFQLHQSEGEEISKVSYNSRRICDKLVQNIQETGKIREFGFASKRDPCQSYFGKVMSTFKEAQKKPDPSIENIGVALSINMPGLSSTNAKDIETLTARTDNNRYLPLDPETLEPAGSCDQTVLHPDLAGPLSGTHAKMDPVTGDIFNYNLEFAGPKQVYRIFQVCKETGKTTILAKFPGQPAYIHSILLTEHTVILCVWNSHITHMGISLLWNQNILDSLKPLDKSEKATWYIVDRTPARKGLLATYNTPPFFCFHTINAYETPSPTVPGKVDITADLTGYEDLSILHSFYYKNLTSRNLNQHLKDRSRATFRRYHFPGLSLSTPTKKSLQGKLLHEAPFDHSVDLPTLHPALFTHPYRYHYGVTDHGHASFADGLGKYDSKTQSMSIWREHGQTPGEPIFVPDPKADPFADGAEGEEEDQGVLLSVVCDGIREVSYLLVLDARTMREVGRAEMEVVSSGLGNGGGDGQGPKRVVGFGFHGVHVRKGGKVSAGD